MGLPSNIVEIDTVDAFQGREKEIIIISCVRTDKLGFLQDSRRINVSFTRAKNYLWVVGNENLLKTNAIWRNFIMHAKNIQAPPGFMTTEANDTDLVKRKFDQMFPSSDDETLPLQADANKRIK